MTSCLIVCHGYFGDHLFALSIADRLKKEGQFDNIDYVVGFPKMFPFFERDPNVRSVYCTTVGPSPARLDTWQDYDKCFQLGPVHFEMPPAVEMQLMCGVQHPTSEFSIRTNPEIDARIKEQFDDVRSKTQSPILAIMSNWEERSFLFTREQYAAGIDVPNLGYGGSHRNTDYITSKLNEYYPIVIVGAPPGTTQLDSKFMGQTLDEMASILKNADFFIGAEGGIANFAYAVDTRTILTSDFVHQLYGENGVIRKIKQPQLGPRFYDSRPNYHIDLDPYLTDDEVVIEISKIVDGVSI